MTCSCLTSCLKGEKKKSWTAWSWQIRSYPVPKNLKEVQRFLGFAEWYHKFVPRGWPKKERKTFHLESSMPACLWPIEMHCDFSTHLGSPKSRLSNPSLYWHKCNRSWSCVDPENGQWNQSSSYHLIRQTLRLQLFDFIVEYRKRKLNGAPGALSRMPPDVRFCLYSNKIDGNILISLRTSGKNNIKTISSSPNHEAASWRGLKSGTGFCCPGR